MEAKKGESWRRETFLPFSSPPSPLLHQKSPLPYPLRKAWYSGYNILKPIIHDLKELQIAAAASYIILKKGCFESKRWLKGLIMNLQHIFWNTSRLFKVSLMIITLWSIWNDSFLNCGCRWEWRMIIAVNRSKSRLTLFRAALSLGGQQTTKQKIIIT